MLEIEHLTKKYGGKRAVDDLSLSLGAGRLVALLGPNGSGKTTLMKMIAGLATPSSGSMPMALITRLNLSSPLSTSVPSSSPVMT